jgi:hypothetical protein
MQYYSKKSNALRAAKSRNLDMTLYTVEQTQHGWAILPVASEPAQTPAQPATLARSRQRSAAAKGGSPPTPQPAPAPPKAEDDPHAIIQLARDIFTVKRPHAGHFQKIHDAQRGILPEPPDFSAETHRPHRKKLAAITSAIEARDAAALEQLKGTLRGYSTSPRMMLTYASLALIALRSQK